MRTQCTFRRRVVAEVTLPGPFGWECPKCGKVNAPWIPSCDCSGKGKKQLGLYKLCLKCHTTYGDEREHICPSSPTEME